jgi:hypothetical protein
MCSMTAAALKIRLVHWQAAEAAERAEALVAAGLEVDYRVPQVPAFLAELECLKPAAVVVSLDRLPSRGRDLGVAIRLRSGTRAIPLVFVGGPPEKAAQVRDLLSDAEFTGWQDVVEVVQCVAKAPPLNPVVPAGVFAAYAGRPLSGKLGIREGTVVGVVDAPEDISTILARMPDGARVVDGDGLDRDIILWFVLSSVDLEARLVSVAEDLGRKVLWIAWPKKGSPLESDLTQQRVRRRGLDIGLVDSKICALDETWSGLRFTRRRRINRGG